MSRFGFVVRKLIPGALAVAGAIAAAHVWAGGATAPVQADAEAGVDATRSTRLPYEEARSPELQKQQLEKWCAETRAEIKKLRWPIDPCKGADGDPIPWRIGGTSVQGRPLVFAEFGDPTSNNRTLVLSAVHGDEITPLYLGIQLVHWIKEHRSEYGKVHVMIAPMVNPDGFFRTPRTRTNAHGVDVNRNFATRDWSRKALTAWKRRHRSDPRRYPGSAPRSEPETIFQEELIRLIKPQKILSIHSPLNHLDYDGPSAISLSKFPRDYVRTCLKLRARLKAVSTGFFPGSLGNYAGNELGIPTLTLELPTADPRKAISYWKNFSKGIRTMIQFEMPSYASILVPNVGS